MKGAKHPVDPLRRGAVALQCDQIVRGLADEFAGLGDELFLQSAHGAAPVRTPT